MTKFQETFDWEDVLDEAVITDDQAHGIHDLICEYEYLIDLLIERAQEAGVKLELDHDGLSFRVHAGRVNYRPTRQIFRPRIVKH
jgi:hypothetical protein